MRLQSPSLPTPTPRSGATTCGGCDSRATVRPDKPDPATGPRGRGHRRHRSTPTAHRSASQTRTRGFRAWGRRPPIPGPGHAVRRRRPGPSRAHCARPRRAAVRLSVGDRRAPQPRPAEGGRPGAHTDPAGLLSAARLPHGRRSLGSVRLRGGAPSDRHVRKRGNASTPRVGHAEPRGLGLAEIGQRSRRETRVLGRQDPALAPLA